MGTAVVVDLGSNTVKGGFSHNFLAGEQPNTVLSSWVTKGQASTAASDSGSVQAVSQGRVADWPAVECLLHDILYAKLGWEVDNEGHLLIAEPLLTSRDDREQLAQLAFEVFNVLGLFFADQAVLSLYAVGRSTGVVVDIGHEKTDVSMVVEGQLYLPSARRLPYGGKHFTLHLQQLLRARGVRIEDPLVLQGLKEACTHVDDGSEDAQAYHQKVKLPDDSLVSLGSEGAQLAECMLQPALLGDNASPSVAETAASSVYTHLDPAVRKAAMDFVLVCGGGGRVPGLAQKLCRELRQLMPPSMQPCVGTSPEYMPDNTFHHSAWIGGAVLSKILLQHNHYVSKGEYEESGPAVVHRKLGL